MVALWNGAADRSVQLLGLEEEDSKGARLRGGGVDEQLDQTSFRRLAQQGAHGSEQFGEIQRLLH